jgi:release factor glutamine methyltransferase
MVILTASCLKTDEGRVAAGREEKQGTAPTELPSATSSEQTQTLPVLPLDAHETSSSGPKPAERTDATPIRDWAYVEHLPDRIALFDSVFWDPRDTLSLRTLIAESDLVRDKSVLEIGTGSGLLSLCCLQFGARKVVATDINPMAVRNARYNAEKLGFTGRFEVRTVPPDDPGAYSVIRTSEQFDLIISNPPWEDATPERNIDYAYYDPGFALIQSLMNELRQHLNDNGRALLAYGSVEGIRQVKRLSAENELHFRILDDRDPDALPPVFVPGMLLEVSP